MSKCACGKYPTYGLLGNTERIWCSKCKPDGAVDVKNKKCPCGKRPSYGLPGEPAKWCKDCPEKPKDAINVKHKKCPCGKIPSYGLPGEPAKWCKDCKLKDAVNVVNKRCPCGKSQPVFGLPGEKATWCKDCKPQDAVDVVNKRCPCGKSQPVFGLPGEKATWCKDCKQVYAVNVTHKKCPCENRAIYGLYGDTRPTWCGKCKPDEAIDIIHKICPGYDGISCPVRTFLMNGKAYCLSCDPDESRRLPRKKDEHAFFMFLDNHNIEVTQREYRIDYRCVETAKSHAFIDGIIITPDIVVCLEVDEDAHKSYTCDEARTNFASHELLLAFPNHHIAWVRVNPTVGNFKRDDKALKIRDERYFEALLSIRNILERPRTEIIYIGYDE
ncbi:hypothetical protein BST79_gp050 [Only Syngen Nebraska virus 5]|uniref:hypothetical protein n=1 Tax=Only Syngen Nebraska virus 5 TaxID=1917232 RepID=UPI0009017980|nr:hypothetical protein BST79_gp050 [Only Syngen Nebraska virus 5]APC25563.1 hypothetical protein [Only Syngen Nebraska virus 5]